MDRSGFGMPGESRRPRESTNDKRWIFGPRRRGHVVGSRAWTTGLEPESQEVEMIGRRDEFFLHVLLHSLHVFCLS